MKISLHWLNAYLDTPVTGDDAQRMLTDQGTPVESRQPILVPGVTGDELLDVEVTSNRSDCLCHVGVAREIVAGSARKSPRKLKPPSCDWPVGAEKGPDVATLTSVDNQAPDDCPVYTARVIRGVKVGPSPAWLVQRLQAVGLRSVNNVVDVTNFVMLELGQPLHAFDMALLEGRRIVVRKARKGEPFEAIDGSRHLLAQETLVIADAKNPAAVAGVMGGKRSEVGPRTADVLIESALFRPLSIRRASRAMKLASDSSYRFERGIDPRGVELASRRAAGLILELAGGELARGVIRAGRPEPEPRKITLRVAHCNAVMGISLSEASIVDLLAALGLSPAGDQAGKIACTIPTFRLDLEREIDLVEEVGRLHGLDAVPVHDRIQISARGPQPMVEARRKLGQVLAAHGYHETINFSFVAPREGQVFVPAGQEPLMIDDERRKSEPMLRPSLLPSLLHCRKSNQDVGNADVRVYEVAACWTRENGKPVEKTRLALLADAPDAQAAVRDLRGTIGELVEALGGRDDLMLEPAEHPALAVGASVVLGGAALGVLGVVNKEVQERFALQSPVACAELDLKSLVGLYPPKRAVGPLPRFPGTERDLSIVVPEEVAWAAIEAEVRAAGPALMEGLRFLVAYRGKPIPAGFKSVSLRMVFRDPASTLRHEQVEPQVAAVVERLKSNLGAQLRA